MSFLKKVYVEDPRDTFSVGEMIRWTMWQTYTYGVIKTPAGWYTTSAKYDNTSVPQIVDFEDLLRILMSPDASDVEYASAWQPLEIED